MKPAKTVDNAEIRKYTEGDFCSLPDENSKPIAGKEKEVVLKIWRGGKRDDEV